VLVILLFVESIDESWPFHEPISAIDFGIMHRFWEDETKIDRNLIVETHLTVDCDGECGFFCGGVCFGIMRGKGG